jgi:glutamate racemase
MDDGFIGVFDSGVGGLSVWREIVRELPSEPTLYVADQAHVPYGSRSLSQVLAFAEEITRFLLARGAKVIVIASNTISAASLYSLRNRFPHVPFVGMEPALKPATERTRTRSVGVIATPATFQGELFGNLVRRYTDNVCVLSQACPGLVDAVEAGALDSKETAALLEDYLSPMIRADVDQLVLGCTHYPFLRPVIEQIMGPGTSIIDPAPSVARQVACVLRQHEGIPGSTLPNMAAQEHARHLFYTTGDVRNFGDMIERLLCERTNGSMEVRAVEWQANRLASATPPYQS